MYNARVAKNDEFFTLLTDIEKELAHYEQHFSGKTVLCNCNDGMDSDFHKYFKENLFRLNLNRLICIGYTQNGNGKVYEYTKYTETVKEMDGNGDFRSQESVEYLKQADIVVTNPAFSIFKEYITQLFQYDKKFIVIGNKNAVAYGEVFKRMAENKLWFGINRPDYFKVPSENGFERSRKVYGLSRWFTNLENGRKPKEIKLTKTYNEADYPKYENFNAINVDKVRDIPMDYDGVMGVPVTYMEKHNPSQFEILWRGGDIEWCETKCDFYTPVDDSKASLYRTYDKSWRNQNPYMVVDGKPKTPFNRIFIKKVKK